MFDHISLGVSSLERSAAFYDAVLAALGYVRLFENIRSVCYGPPGFKGEPPFGIIKRREDAKPPGPGFHVAFAAASRDAVDQFHNSALETGGVDEGPPGIRENYDRDTTPRLLGTLTAIEAAIHFESGALRSGPGDCPLAHQDKAYAI